MKDFETIDVIEAIDVILVFVLAVALWEVSKVVFQAVLEFEEKTKAVFFMFFGAVCNHKYTQNGWIGILQSVVIFYLIFSLVLFLDVLAVAGHLGISPHQLVEDVYKCYLKQQNLSGGANTMKDDGPARVY